MKIIDRYVLGTFFKNYLISFMVLIGLYVALDMVFHFGDLIQDKGVAEQSASLWSVLYDIFDYYYYQVFVIFVQLSGVIAVVAAAFTLVRLSRFNELTAVLAAGTPLLRVALSIVVAGAVLNLVLLPIDQELIIPQMIPKLVRSHEDVHLQNARSYPVQMMQDPQNNDLLLAGRYTPPTTTQPATIEQLDVIQRDDQLRPEGHVMASSAVWNDAARRWDLTGGRQTPILTPEQTASPHERAVTTFDSNITPDEVALWRGGDIVQFLPTARINQLLQRPKSYGTNALLRAKHLRFTQPLANVILLLLAIPAVLTREPGALKIAAVRCLTLCGLCLGSVFLAYELAATAPVQTGAWPTLWPALMAWMPIFIFGPLAVYLLDRVKT